MNTQQEVKYNEIENVYSGSISQFSAGSHLLDVSELNKVMCVFIMQSMNLQFITPEIFLQCTHTVVYSCVTLGK